MLPITSDQDFVQHAMLLWDSFYKWTGKKLMDSVSEDDPLKISEALYHAPFVLVSHGTQPDPVFNYANLQAQQLWKMSWDKFTSQPSRYSAEAVAREERQQLLEQAERFGHITGYKGVRITADGKRFNIVDTILWNVVDQQGNYKGQAAVFDRWEWL